MRSGAWCLREGWPVSCVWDRLSAVRSGACQFETCKTCTHGVRVSLSLRTTCGHKTRRAPAREAAQDRPRAAEADRGPSTVDAPVAVRVAPAAEYPVTAATAGWVVSAALPAPAPVQRCQACGGVPPWRATQASMVKAWATPSCCSGCAQLASTALQAPREVRQGTQRQTRTAADNATCRQFIPPAHAADTLHTPCFQGRNEQPCHPTKPARDLYRGAGKLKSPGHCVPWQSRSRSTPKHA